MRPGSPLTARALTFTPHRVHVNQTPFEKERGMKMLAKAAITVKVQEVYYLQPGPEAGKAVA